MEIITYENLDENIKTELLEAEKAAKNAFPRNRDVKIGAVVVSGDKIFLGSNIERERFANSTCAERMALDTAVFNGVEKIDRIIIIGINEEYPFVDVVAPCGACRQNIFDTLTKLSQEDVNLILSNSDKSKIVKIKLSELLPLSYKSSRK